jgi:hypothetical protein
MDTAVTDLQAEVNRLRHELQTLEVQHENEEGELITISEYILKRLEQLNVTVCALQLCTLNLSSLPTVYFRIAGRFQHAYALADNRRTKH